MNSDPAASIASPAIRETVGEDGRQRLELAGAWNLQALERSFAGLASRLRALAADPAWHWDLTRVEALDHAGAMLLWRAWGRTLAANLVLRPEQEAIFRSLGLPEEEAPSAAPRDWAAPVVAIGRPLVTFGLHLRDVSMLLGQVIIDLGYVIVRPSRLPWREISANIFHTGAQALPITALVGFLVGITLSYLSATQLKTFGADVFIVNILGISIVRELGPVLAAILIAGRSGSAMTAQLGVMRVTEELDAMAVMGIPHSLRLVLPKMVALAVSLPLIVLWTNAIALVGGAFAAHHELGIAPIFFVSRLPDVVPIANLWLGLGKGMVFGLLIALVACHFGMRIEPNTESLGTGTTASVVTSITVVIIVDAIFAVVYRDVGMF